MALRAQREAAADEADKKRREAAQAKLAELDQRIARRCACIWHLNGQTTDSHLNCSCAWHIFT